MSETRKKVTRKKVTKKETASESPKIEKKSVLAKRAFQYSGKKYQKGTKVDLGIEALKQLKEQGLVE